MRQAGYMEKIITDELFLRSAKTYQENELTEYHIYSKLAKIVKDGKNSRVLKEIAGDELRHSEFWKKFSQTEVKPKRLRVFFYYWLGRIFGITFAVKLMEKGESRAGAAYEKLAAKIPEAGTLRADEDEHEAALLEAFQEERLKYVGSIVLGLNDALVELTGSLAGLTFALQNNRLVALAGLVTGIAASFAMTASGYLSAKSGEDGSQAWKSAMYTGCTYIVTVALLILPFFLFSNVFISLGATVLTAVLIIFVFTYYISVAKDLNFWRRFLEMAGISLGVAAFSFAVGRILGGLTGVPV
jgi:VIT1/CCC1 family predicted Fe2+/Mn2+ transporter